MQGRRGGRFSAGGRLRARDGSRSGDRSAPKASLPKPVSWSARAGQPLTGRLLDHEGGANMGEYTVVGCVVACLCIAVVGGFGELIERGGKWCMCHLEALPDVTADCSQALSDGTEGGGSESLLDGVTRPTDDTATVWDPERGEVVEMTREALEAARAAGAALQEIDESETLVVRNPETGDFATTTWDVFLAHLKDQGWRISSRDETVAKLDDQGRLILMSKDSRKLAAMEIPDGVLSAGVDADSDQGRAEIEQWLVESGLADDLRLQTEWDRRIAKSVDPSKAEADHEQTDAAALGDQIGEDVQLVAANPEVSVEAALGLSEWPGGDREGGVPATGIESGAFERGGDAARKYAGLSPSKLLPVADHATGAPRTTQWTLAELYFTQFPTWDARWAAMDEWGKWAHDRVLENIAGLGKFAASPFVDLYYGRLGYPEGHERWIPNVGLVDDVIAGVGLALWDQTVALAGLAWNTTTQAVYDTVMAPWRFINWLDLSNGEAWQKWRDNPSIVPAFMRENMERMGPLWPLAPLVLKTYTVLDARATMNRHMEETCHGTGTPEDCAELYGRIGAVVLGPAAVQYLRARYATVLPRPRNPNAMPFGQMVDRGIRDFPRNVGETMRERMRGVRRSVGLEERPPPWRRNDSMDNATPSQRKLAAENKLPPIALSAATAHGIATLEFEGETFLGHPVKRRRIPLDDGGHVDEYWTRTPGGPWRLLGRVYREGGGDGPTGPSVARSAGDLMPWTAAEDGSGLTLARTEIGADGRERTLRYVGVIQLPGDGNHVEFVEVGVPQRSHWTGIPRDPYRAALEPLRPQPGDMRVILEPGPEGDWIVTFLDPPTDPGGYDPYRRFLARKLGDGRPVHRFEPAGEADGVSIVGMEPEPRPRSTWPPGRTEQHYADTGVGLIDAGAAPTLSELDQFGRTRRGENAQPMSIFNSPFHADVDLPDWADQPLSAELLAEIERRVTIDVARRRAGLTVPNNEEAQQREAFRVQTAIERGVRAEVQRHENVRAALRNLRFLDGDGRVVWIDDSSALSFPDTTQPHVLLIAPNDVRTTADGDPTFTGANVYGANVDRQTTAFDYGDLVRRYGVPIDLNPRNAPSGSTLGAVVGVDVFPAIDSRPGRSRMVVHVDSHPAMTAPGFRDTTAGPNKGQVVAPISDAVRDFLQQTIYPDVHVVHPAELFVDGTMPHFEGSIEDMKRIIQNSPVLSPASRQYLLDRPPFSARGPGGITTPTAVVTFDYGLVHGYEGENVQLTLDQLAWALDHLSHIEAIDVKEPWIDPDTDQQRGWRMVRLRERTRMEYLLEQLDAGWRLIPYGISKLPGVRGLRDWLFYDD